MKMKALFYSLPGYVLGFMFLLLYCTHSGETAGQWVLGSGMPETFTPRQIVAEIWCVACLLGMLISLVGANLSYLLVQVSYRPTVQVTVESPSPKEG